MHQQPRWSVQGHTIQLYSVKIKKKTLFLKIRDFNDKVLRLNKCLWLLPVGLVELLKGQVELFYHRIPEIKTITIC